MSTPDMMTKAERDLKDLTWTAYWLQLIAVFGSMLFPLLAMLNVFAFVILIIKRKAVIDTVYHSHFQWMMRTLVILFAVTVVFVALGGALFLGGAGVKGMLGGAGFILLIVPVAGLFFFIWNVWRLIKGMIRLSDKQPIARPKSFF